MPQTTKIEIDESMHKDRQPRSAWRIGPGLLVTAAFIGPGTVATASRAGAEFGYALLWSLAFAVVAAIVLQEMAARLGLVTRLGMAEAILSCLPSRWLRCLAIGLVLTAIVLGAAAYQTGNLLGAGMGLALIVGGEPRDFALGVGAALAVIIVIGRDPRWIYRILVVAVLLMSVAFLVTAGLADPQPGHVLRGISHITLPPGALLPCLALVGTTVVPYNLFLHARAVQDCWPAEQDTERSLRAARWDAAIAIGLGGVMTMAIMTTAAATFFDSGALPMDAAQMARQLEPLLGSTAQGLFAFGLAAAGVTSGLTAPLAAGYAAAGCLSSTSKLVEVATALAVIAVGSGLAYTLESSPQITIIVAQAANAILLPVVAAFLVYAVNQPKLMGTYRNRTITNLLAGTVLIVTVVLGAKSLWLLGSG